MSKVLLINGSPNEHGCTYTALCEVAASLEKNGIETEMLYLGKAPVPGCIACGRCRRDGLCSFGGQVNDIIKRIDEFDGIVAGSPVYYAAASGQITSFMDRLFYAAGRKMRGKVGAAVVSCRRGGASAAFDQVFLHIPDAYSHLRILEPGTRQYPGAGARGQGGAPDHALSGGKHGVAHKVHTGGQSRRRCRAGAGETGNHEFYTIGQIRYEALAFDRAAG